MTKSTVLSNSATDPLAFVFSLVVVLLGQLGLFNYLGLDGDTVGAIAGTVGALAAGVRALWNRRVETTAPVKRHRAKSSAHRTK